MGMNRKLWPPIFRHAAPCAAVIHSRLQREAKCLGCREPRALVVGEEVRQRPLDAGDAGETEDADLAAGQHLAQGVHGPSCFTSRIFSLLYRKKSRKVKRQLVPPSRRGGLHQLMTAERGKGERKPCSSGLRLRGGRRAERRGITLFWR